MDEASYERVIGTLYQGALDDAAWDRGLKDGGADHRKPGLGAFVHGGPLTTLSRI
jgi:hypothetical protein